MMKLRSDMILREVAGEYVAVSMGTEQGANCMVRLNSTGAFLWKKLAGGAELTDLARALVDAYGITKEQALEDSRSFTELLKQKGILA